MSYDLTLFSKPCESCGLSREAREFNYTFNIRPILDECGMPFQELAKFKGDDLVMELISLNAKLRSPVWRERLDRLNPPNGWGSRAGLADLMGEILEAALEFDEPVLRVDC